MRITELLKQESIGLNVSVSTKDEAIDKLVDLMDAGGRLKDKPVIRKESLRGKHLEAPASAAASRFPMLR